MSKAEDCRAYQIGQARRYLIQALDYLHQAEISKDDGALPAADHNMKTAFSHIGKAIHYTEKMKGEQK